MSMDIGGIGSAPAAGVTPASNIPASTPLAPTPPTPDDEAVTVDVRSFEAGPPPEVSAAVQTASAAYDKLAAAGQHVQFGLDSSGSLSIELQGEDGSSQTLSPSEALRLAAGESTD